MLDVANIKENTRLSLTDNWLHNDYCTQWDLIAKKANIEYKNNWAMELVDDYLQTRFVCLLGVCKIFMWKVHGAAIYISWLPLVSFFQTRHLCSLIPQQRIWMR